MRRKNQFSETRNLWADMPWLAELQGAASYENWGINRLAAIAAMRRIVNKSMLAQAYVNIARSQVIGHTAPTPTFSEVKSNKKNYEALLELWAKFSMDPTTEGTDDMAGMLRAMVASLVVDGRVFGLIRRHNDYSCGIAVQMCERDWLAGQENVGQIETYRSPQGDYEGVNGVIRASSGRVSHYAFLEGSSSTQQQIRDRALNRATLLYGGTRSYEKVIVPASNVLDLMDSRNASDWEGGISHLLPQMNKLLEIARLDAALVQAMEVAATTYGFIKRDKEAPPHETQVDQDGGQDNYAPNPAEFVNGAIEQLDRGSEFQSYQGNAPNGSINEYRKDIIKNIAAGLGLGFSELAGDVSESNYSSMRHAAVVARENHMQLQSVIDRRIIRPLLKALLDIAQLRGDISLTRESYKKALMTEVRHKSFPWISPQEDVMAAKESVKLGIDSPQRIARQLGRDWKQIMVDLAEAAKEAKKAGIPFPPDQPSEPANGGKGQQPAPSRDRRVIKKSGASTKKPA